MMNKHVYLCLHKRLGFEDYHVLFSSDPQTAFDELSTGGRVFKLNSLTELKQMNIEYTEIAHDEECH